VGAESLDPVNILIVDDRPENLTALAAILDEPGYRVVSAASANDALRAVLKETFAVVLCDVRMPVMDGIQLAGLIKSRDKSRDLPIIFITSSGLDADSLLQAYELGAVDYLVRPVHPQVVRAKVAVFADLFRKTEQVKRQAERLREYDRRESDAQLADMLRRAETARARAEQMQRRMTIVAEVSRLLSESLDPSTSLDKVARYLVETMSRGCVIEIRDDEGKPVPVAVAHQDPEGEAKIRDRLPNRRVASEKDMLVTSITAQGRAVGSITLLGTTSSEGWDAEEREFVSDIGGRIGLFVENANLYEKAQRAIAERDEFLSIAAHELRTPLTAMMLQIQALSLRLKKQSTGVFPVEVAMTKIEAAERQLARLTYLVEALLDVSRIASRHLSLELSKVDLAQVARDVAGKFAESAARDGSPIEVRAVAPVFGLWDPARIEQILTNLVANAVKFGAGKPVEIEVGTDGATAFMSVRDHGPGIAREQAERIFDRFERGASSRGHGGLGLGLYITRQLVVAHAGTIAVQSEPGSGAELVVRLPLATSLAAEFFDDPEQHADLDGLSQHA
jgi:signal transduction histidine kinase/DNA-binding response OmpR family regulator